MLVNLLDCYQTDKVKQICPTCQETINAKLWDLRDVTSRWTRKKMRQFIGGSVAVEKPKQWWWQRIGQTTERDVA